MATVLAEISDDARRARAKMSTGNGPCFEVVEFMVTNGGHDPANSDIALTPDTTIDLDSIPGSQVFGPKIITSKGNQNNDFTSHYVLNLAKSEAIGQVSLIGLIAEYTSSPIPNDPLVGTKFLYAIGTLPLQNKLAGEKRQFNVFVNY